MAEVVDHYHGIRGFIVLAHFCEQHGPSVAYSTRLIRADTSLYHFSFPASSPSATNVSAPTRPAQHKQLSMSSSLILSPSKKLMPSSSFVARSAVPPSPLSLPARDGSSSPGLLPQDPSPRGEDSTTPHHHHHHASHAAKKSRRRKESRKRASVVVDPFASVISKTPFTQSAAFLARKPDANKKSPASRKTFRKARNDRMQSYFERHSNDDGLDSDSDSERDSASGSDEEDFGLSSSSASSSDLEGSDNAAGSVDSSSEGDAPGDLFLTLLPSHVEPVASAALPPNSSSPSSSSPSPPSQDASGDTPSAADSSASSSQPISEPTTTTTSMTTAAPRSPLSALRTAAPAMARPSSDEQPSSSSLNCVACGSVPEGKGFFSYDEPHSSYAISTRYPEPGMYSRIRRACVRSLSCEQCTGREGSVVFEEDNTSTFAYLFKLADFKARGYQRFYSLLFILPNLPQLLTAHPYLEASFRLIVADLKDRANVLFLKEQASQPSQNMASAFFPSGAGQFRRRMGMHALRPLTEIAGLPNLYKRLHAQFSQILFGCYSLLHEKSLQFNVGVVGSRQAHHAPQPAAAAAAAAAAVGTTAASTSQADPHEHCSTQIATLLFLKQHLGSDGLSRLVYHILIGNQIILRGAPPDLQETLLQACATLLPEACRVIIFGSPEYREQWECNFLGITPGVSIPDHVDFSLTFILDYHPDGLDKPLRICTDPSPYVHYLPPLAGTTLGEQILSALAQPRLSPHAQSILLQIQTEEWVNKAKLFLKMTKTLENEDDPKLSQFIRIFSLKKADIRVLRFFSTGMKRPIILSHFLWSKTLNA